MHENDHKNTIEIKEKHFFKVSVMFFHNFGIFSKKCYIMMVVAIIKSEMILYLSLSIVSVRRKRIFAILL